MDESVFKIRLLGDTILRKKSKSIKHITSAHRDILSKMARTLYAASGVGLAAPQVGINEAMIIVDIGSGLYKLINPKIVKREGFQVMEEGCLSMPRICIKVRRAKKILVKAQDENARHVSIEAEDLLACVLQHEIDHLKGKLIVDYASFWDKFKLRNKLREFKKRSEYEKLSESETKSCKLQL